MNKKVIIFLLSLINFIHAGFLVDTLIKTDNSYVPIQFISDRNHITSFDSEINLIDTSELIHTFTMRASIYYHIHLANDSIICSENQKFYNPRLQKWIKAKDVSQESYFLDYYGNSIPCIKIDHIQSTKPIIFYEITLSKPHTYFVSKAQIFTHNVAPIVIGLSWALGEGIALTGAGVGLGALGLGLWQKFGNKKQISFAQIEHECVASSGGNTPDPDKNKDKLKNRRNKAERLANEMGFKEVKDYKFNSHGEKVFRKGDIEITLDRDSHNGGFWKMFKRKTYNRLGTYNQDLSTKIGK